MQLCQTVRYTCLSLLIVLAILLLPLQVLAAKTATPSTAPLAPVEIAADESCPVCGMAPARFPKWQCQIQFEDGSHVSFESPRDMLIFMNDLEAYDHLHDKMDFKAILVRDYATGAWADAQKAHFVAGSSIKGPMGEEFIPFTQLETVRQFIMSKSGQFFALRQLDDTVLRDFIPASQFKAKETMKK